MWQAKAQWGALAVAIVAAVNAVALADPPAAEEPAVTPEQIARLIAQLDADKFDDRERATRELAEIGWPAMEALRQARLSKSAEVRYRAKALIESLTFEVRRREFTAFCSQPDEQLDLEHGLWLIARILDPAVKKADLVKQLDDLAARVRQQLPKGTDPATENPAVVVAAVRKVLFDDLKFTGNTQDYYHPDNSSLARVLETKQGLPILLSQVTMAVGRRLRVPIVGVPAGGRYLVKYDGSRAPAGFSQDDIYFSPFESGRLLTENERPAGVVWEGPREDLTRTLRNLIPALESRPERSDELKAAQELFELLVAHAPQPMPR
ncbi:MAG: transglutaminase-like domain-containing protein [Pirellulaceae bacterium]|nr:transglutaminase-like domain-containing protein [Pirellulaceae bacterium]